MKEVQIDGQDICIVNVDGKYYAIGNVCIQVGGPLVILLVPYYLPYVT